MVPTLFNSHRNATQRKFNGCESQEGNFDSIASRLPTLVRYDNPFNVLSKAKSSRAAANRSNSVRNKRRALSAARSGFNGDRPAANKSAFTKRTTPASFGKNSRAKVVLPAPFGPAMMMHRDDFISIPGLQLHDVVRGGFALAGGADADVARLFTQLRQVRGAKITHAALDAADKLREHAVD